MSCCESSPNELGDTSNSRDQACNCAARWLARQSVQLPADSWPWPGLRTSDGVLKHNVVVGGDGKVVQEGKTRQVEGTLGRHAEVCSGGRAARPVVFAKPSTLHNPTAA